MLEVDCADARVVSLYSEIYSEILPCGEGIYPRWRAQHALFPIAAKSVRYLTSFANAPSASSLVNSALLTSRPSVNA